MTEIPDDIMAKAREGQDDPLHLTEYEIQVLLGCSIYGCRMSPDRVFSLHMAWHRLFATGLIDRSDGLAIITTKGRAVIDRILALLSERTASEAALKEARFSRDYWKRMHDEVKAAFLAKTGGA